MIQSQLFKKMVSSLAVLILFVAGISTATAAQLTLSFIDDSGQAQTLSIDMNSSTADLEKAASLMGIPGTLLAFTEDEGNGTLAEIAAAMATAAPDFAADIAQALVQMFPASDEAIVAAINAVDGVDTTEVLAAVNYESGAEPILAESSLPAIEPVASRN